MNTQDTIAFFLPTRKGSERVKNKNTRTFADLADGLIGNKISQIIQCKLIDEIIISTNDESCIKIAKSFKDSRIKIDQRPDSLCSSNTNLSDLIKYVPTITKASHILWGHVTTPITDARDYDDGIVKYRDALRKGFDSLVGVKKINNFILNKSGEIINNTKGLVWPRTQDLEPLFEINHSMFIASREIYVNTGNRLGVRPFLYEMNALSSFDIDWEEDFEIAEILYKYNFDKN